MLLKETDVLETFAILGGVECSWESREKTICIHWTVTVKIGEVVKLNQLAPQDLIVTRVTMDTGMDTGTMIEMHQVQPNKFIVPVL